MTHFLGRLVERARGTAPLVEPIIAPRFASAPLAEIATEHEAAPPVRESAGETKVANGIGGTVVRQKEPVRERSRRREERPAAIETQRREKMVEETVEAAPLTLLVSVQRPNDGEIAPPSAWTRGSESLRRNVLPSSPSAAAPPTVRRASHQPRSTIARSSDRRVVSANSLPFPNESDVSEPPIVRVTIGRIEVHAASPPSAPPRKPAPRSEPKLTLDAYLKARKEGAR
jgi:hypothetical protein